MKKNLNMMKVQWQKLQWVPCWSVLLNGISMVLKHCCKGIVMVLYGIAVVL